MLRLLQTLPFLAVGAGIASTAIFWDALARYRLHGVAVVALIFLAVFALGLALQLGQDFRESPPRVVLRAFLHYTGQALGFLLAFTAGCALLLLLVRVLLEPVLPEILVYIAFLAAFTWYLWGVIRALRFLRDRNLIGPGALSESDPSRRGK